MITKVFDRDAKSFSQWYEQNKGIEKLILKGNYTYEELDVIDKILGNIQVIDITDTTANSTKEESFEEQVIYRMFDDDIAPRIIDKIILNKHYANVFTISKDYIFSETQKILIHSFCTPLIPQGTEIIGKCSFAQRKGIRVLEIPETVKEIGDFAFYECSDFSELKLPDSVIKLGESAFSGCDIDKLILSQNLTRIPIGCFTFCYIDDMTIPSSIKVIEQEAFHRACCCAEIILSEGVEEIQYNAFDGLRKISFPSTMKIIEKDFYYEEMCDAPKEVPYIEVHPDNPYFYAKNGTLYKRGDDAKPYLGYIYKSEEEKKKEEEEKEEKRNPFHPPRTKTKEYTPAEIYAMYPPNNCRAIDSEETKFLVYKSETGYNIIDRCLNIFFREHNAYDIWFAKDKFILYRNNYFKTTIYALDCQTILREQEKDSRYLKCDNEGRIYVEKEIPREVPKGKLWNPYQEKYGCIDIDGNIIIPFEYKELYLFDEKGFAVARKGNKYGCINIENQIVIPFEYNFFYRHFLNVFPWNFDVAIVDIGKKNQKHLFIDRNNTIQGEFLKYDIWEKKFHIFKFNDKYGYTRQFGDGGELPIYTDIQEIDEKTIKVSIDGVTYKTITY